MTADEALALVETVLDDDRLNDVQELIFRQCWEGRQSYEEIAQISQYDNEYIKHAAAKLWRLLSEALGEKVKKGNLQSVIKRYARQNQVTIHRNQGIGVNFSGANLRGARLLFLSELSELDSRRAELHGAIISSVENTKTGKKIKPDGEGKKEGVQQNTEEELYFWNGWNLHSDEQVKIAEALDRAGVFFSPNSRVRATTPDGRQNQKYDFLICHEGKCGILQVGYEEKATEEELSLFQARGIRIVQHYDATLCREQPDRVVQEFLAILSQAE